MKILSAAQTRLADQYTIDNEPVKSVDLMERAGIALVEKFMDIAKPKPNSHIHIFVGSGNNGGDSLVIVRYLLFFCYKVSVYLTSENRSPDSQINFERLQQAGFSSFFMLKEETDFPTLQATDWIIDALFGSGLTRPVEGLNAQLIHHLNGQAAPIVSIDIPSGLTDEHCAQPNAAIIKAKHTLAIEMPFLSFLFAENYQFTGTWHLVEIKLNKAFIESLNSPYNLTLQSDIAPLLKPRPKFTHKGTFGHALLIAGSYGKGGAAVLAAKACLRAGVGLLTVQIPEKLYDILQIAVPEAMVNTDPEPKHSTTLPDLLPYNAIGIGPGLGTNPETAQLLYKLITSADKPLVIDADALNLLSQNPDWLNLLPENTVLTPHPKEFDRLSGITEPQTSCQRLQTALTFAQHYKLIVVLKGPYTAVMSPSGSVHFNTTGNPGMATAGSGDVLTGILTGLIAQGFEPLQAAILGVYLQGEAGDKATAKHGERGMIAGDIIEAL